MANACCDTCRVRLSQWLGVDDDIVDPRRGKRSGECNEAVERRRRELVEVRDERDYPTVAFNCDHATATFPTGRRGHDRGLIALQIARLATKESRRVAQIDFYALFHRSTVSQCIEPTWGA